jgi:hypothetical protein
MANATSTQLQELYVAYFGRAADPTGLDYWTAKGISQASFAADMYAQAEFKDAYGSLSVEAQVNQIYQNLFDREADVTGLTYWTQEINLGNLKVAEIATHLIWAAQNNSGSATDKTALTNKTNAAIAYTAKVKESTAGILAYAAESTSPWVSGSNITEANTYMGTINATTAHTAAGVAASVAIITSNGVQLGTTTHTLTTSSDSFTGTSVNDVFSASTVLTDGGTNTTVATTSTLTAADTLVGGTGTDSLELSVTGGVNGTGQDVPAADIKGVEKFFIRNTAVEKQSSDTLDLDASLYSGLTEVWSDRSTSSLDITGLATGAKFGLKGNGVTTLDAITGAYATSTDAITISIDGDVEGDSATDITMGTSSATSATITSTGGTNEVSVIDLTGGSASVTSVTIDATTDLTLAIDAAAEALTGLAADATLTITGAGAVDLSNQDGSIDTIDASGNSGGVTINLAAGDDVFTGGSGNDLVKIAASQTVAVAGGAGTDTVSIGDSADVDTATEAAFITGFETLRVLDDNTTAESYDTSLISGITKIEIGAVNHTSDDVTLTKLSSSLANAITMKGDNAAGLTITLDDATGGSDTASLTMGDAAAATTESYDIAEGLTFNDIETLTITTKSGASSTTAGKVSSIASITSDDATSLILKGESLTFTNAALTKAATYDGSALTGVLSLAGDLIAGSTVTGGAGNDTITIGQTGSTYSGGAGNDSFTAAVADMESGGVFSTISGGAGTDTLVYTAAAHTVVDSNFKSVTGFEKILHDTDAGNSALSFTTGGFFATAFANGVTIDSDTGTASQVIDMGTYDAGATVDLNVNVTTADVTVTTGAGADTVKIVETAGTSACFKVTTGAGNDAVEFTDGAGITDLSIAADALQIDTGLGKDTVNFKAVDADQTDHYDVEIDAGESLTTGYDEITGYNGGDTTVHGILINFTGSADHASAVTNVAVAGYTSSELLMTSSAVGLVTWAGTSAATLGLDAKITAVQTQFTSANDTVVFTHSSDSYVFHNNSTADSLVKLVGFTSTGVDTGTATSTLVHVG